MSWLRVRALFLAHLGLAAARVAGAIPPKPQEVIIGHSGVVSLLWTHLILQRSGFSTERSDLFWPHLDLAGHLLLILLWLPEFDSVSFRIHDPAEFAVVAAFNPRINIDAFTLQLRQNFIQIFDL